MWRRAERGGRPRLLAVLGVALPAPYSVDTLEQVLVSRQQAVQFHLLVGDGAGDFEGVAVFRGGRPGFRGVSVFRGVFNGVAGFGATSSDAAALASTARMRCERRGESGVSSAAKMCSGITSTATVWRRELRIGFAVRLRVPLRVAACSASLKHTIEFEETFVLTETCWIGHSLQESQAAE